MTACAWSWLALGLAAAGGGASVDLAVDPAHITGRVDPKVYGQFLEHIYHSCNGGLWGDLVWNRSFEEAPGGGAWARAGDELLQSELSPDVRLVFGDERWSDIEYTVEARKDGGAEGFLLLVRCQDDGRFYWLNLGGWGNQRHGLERSLQPAGGRPARGTVAPAAGHIESDRWYRLKARCEGPRLRFWVDDQLLIDYTDDGRGPRTGKVGLGSWVSSVRYRNIKVTDLAGKVLYEGLPTPTGQGLPRHWQAYGPGQAATCSDQPYNSRRCLSLVGAAGAETGVSQQRLALAAGQRYVGSLFARGSAPDGLVLRLTVGEQVIAEQRLPAPTAEWAEYPIRFRAAQTTTDATLRLGLVGAGQVWLDQVSFMPLAWSDAGGFRPDLVQAVADLRPPVIRWPGGCYAERYRWKDGIGPQSKRGRFPISIWDDVDTNSIGTDEFIELCRRVGAEPLIVVNIGRHDPATPRAEYVREALDWMEYCNGSATSRWGRVRAANGHPQPYGVKYWEIDNETWGLGAEEYARYVLEFAPAMKAADPTIELAVCGSAGYGEGGNGLAWNKTLIDRCAPLFDFLSIHHYENPDNYDRGPRAYESFFAKTGDLLLHSANPKARLFVSEWNAQSTDWRTGLYCGGILNAFERQDYVGMASPALFLRHTSANAWDNAFINFDQSGWFAAPNYVVMKLYWDHWAPQRLALDGTAGPLNAVATLSDDGRALYLKAVNPSDQPVAVKLTVKGGARAAALALVAPDALSARNTLAARDTVRPTGAPVKMDGEAVGFSLPRWSVGVLTVTR